MAKKVQWEKIKLIIFDVDGTLYNQKKLRLSMGYEMIKQTLINLDFSIIPIIRHYRIFREKFGDDEIYDFEKVLIKKTSLVTGHSEEKVSEVINEWIEIKPIKYLLSARYEGIDELFTSIKKNGKTIGILSDYKATVKLRALKLNADLIVSAEDDEIKMLKPNPKGLHYMLKQAGVSNSEAILIGDRDERDGEASRRVGIQYLIKKKTYENLNEYSFVDFKDEVFYPLLYQSK
jgi:putative hydrolase of the HAD superfamily